MPVLSLEVAFGDAWNDSTPTWVDVTTSVRSDPPIRISRGTSRISRPRPGTLTVTLDNTGQVFDPDNASGAYANDLVPMAQVRLRATHNAVTYELWRGYASEWRVNTEDFKDSTTTLVAVDGLSVLEMLRIESPFSRLAASLNPKAWYRFSEPTGATVLIDESGNGYSGTVSGVTLGSAGDIGGETDRAGDFDSTDYVELPTASGIASGSMTVLAMFNSGNVTPAANYSNFWAQGKPTVAGAEDTVAGQIDLRLFGGGPNDVRFRVIPVGGSSVSLDSAATIDALWHQAVGVISGTDLLLYLDGVSVDTDTWAGGTFNPQQIRIGYAEVTGSGSYDGLLSEVVIFASALSAANILALYNTATAPWDSQLTSARITAILDAAGWESALRDLDTGLTTMDELTATGTALTLIYQAVDSENGAAWITGAGKLWFGNRNWRNTSSYTATFSNDGSDTPYQGLTWHRDQTTLRTVAQVTDRNAAVTEHIGSNEPTYGPRVISRTTYTESATEPYDYATWLTAEYGTPRTDADLLLVAGASTTAAIWAELLSRELGDLVNVEVKPVGGTSQNDYDMLVEEITHTITVDQWTTRLGLSNAQDQRMFILDNTVIGVLDGPGRLGW